MCKKKKLPPPETDQKPEGQDTATEGGFSKYYDMLLEYVSPDTLKIIGAGLLGLILLLILYKLFWSGGSKEPCPPCPPCEVDEGPIVECFAASGDPPSPVVPDCGAGAGDIPIPEPEPPIPDPEPEFSCPEEDCQTKPDSAVTCCMRTFKKMCGFGNNEKKVD